MVKTQCIREEDAEDRVELQLLKAMRGQPLKALAEAPCEKRLSMK